MSASTPALLAAIEGYAGEHAGSKEHEPNIQLLKRVKGEIEKGHGGDQIMSPGRREAQGAAQKNMPAESGHDGGKGSIKTNEPGSASQGERAANPQDESHGTQDVRGMGPAPSDGHVTANLHGASAPSGIVEMRRMAASKGLEAGSTSGGNRRSNPPGDHLPASNRIGDVKAPAGVPADRNTLGDGFEGGPPIGGKDQLRGDGWTKAREKAKSMAPSR